MDIQYDDVQKKVEWIYDNLDAVELDQVLKSESLDALLKIVFFEQGCKDETMNYTSRLTELHQALSKKLGTNTIKLTNDEKKGNQ